MLTIAALCALPMPDARAGNWTVRWYSAPHTAPSENYLNPWDFMEIPGVATPADLLAKATLNETATPAAFYTPDGDLADDPMPATVSIGTVSFVYLIVAEQSGPTDGQIPGASATATTPAGSMSNLVVSSNGNQDMAGIYNSAKRLYTKSTASAPTDPATGFPYVVFDPVSISGQVQVTGDPDDQVMIFWGFSGQEDTRSVSLSRAGAIGEWTNYEDGVAVTHGNTIYSYGVDTALDPDSWYRANHHFVSSLNGDWSSIGTAPLVTWNWSDGSPLISNAWVTPDGKYTADRQSDFGGLTWHNHLDENLNLKSKWTGTGVASQTATMTYDVTDQGDGAKATAKYVLDIHEPIEKQSDNASPVYAYFPFWGSGASPTDPHGVMNVPGPFPNPPFDNPYVTTSTGESHGTSISVNGEFGPEDVGAALGLSATWSSENNTSVAGNWPLNITVTAEEFAYPVVQDKYMRHRIDYRHFEIGGEHTLPLTESPLGSGIYILPLHQIVKDEFKGRIVVWNKLPIDTGEIPPYSPGPVAPNSTDPSGGAA